jgi:hypothetical protein
MASHKLTDDDATGLDVLNTSCLGAVLIAYDKTGWVEIMFSCHGCASSALGQNNVPEERYEWKLVIASLAMDTN